MSKPVEYYYADSRFQLELNLHKIRRELILMIEEFEKKDCLICMQLKCCCADKSPEKNSSPTYRSSQGSSGNKDKAGIADNAPSADSLPLPKFKKRAVGSFSATKEGKKHIEAWIVASRTVEKEKINKRPANDAQVLALKKTWNEPWTNGRNERVWRDFKKENIVSDTRVASANAVQVFFNKFKVQSVLISDNIAIVSKVTAAYGTHKSKSSEYSFF